MPGPPARHIAHTIRRDRQSRAQGQGNILVCLPLEQCLCATGGSEISENGKIRLTPH